MLRYSTHAGSRLASLLAGLTLLSLLALPVAEGAAGGTRVSAVSPSSAARSAPVTITGSAFGAKEAGVVLIGGVRAWATDWSDTRIVAYVPEAAPTGSGAVEVRTEGSASNRIALEVTARPPADGTVAWRFETLANYISHRAAVGADGSVYVNDSSGFLYALTPEGALKWVYDGQNSGSQGPTVVGTDGTIYFGVAGPDAAIHAVNPDGTRKWVFDAPESQGPIGGPGIGPDGNIYAVFDLPGPIGVVSLTPAGALRWNTLGTPQVSEYGQVGREIVFGGGLMFWTTKYSGYLYAFGLARGRQRFRVDVSSAGQAAATPLGTVYVPTGIAPRLNAYARTGEFRWSFFGDEPGITNDLSAPDVARGRIYIDRNLSQLYSLEPTPAVRWISDSLLPQGPVPGPIISPTNDVVLMGGQETYGRPGLIQAFSAADGQLLFQIELPLEPDGTCPVPYARPRFTPSGARAYIPAAQLCEAPDQYHSWLYAIDITTP